MDGLYRYGAGGDNIELSVIYYPEINGFRKNRKIQMVMKYYQ
jgi:hypothetical protein